MRFGVLSDVHANLPALEVAVAHLHDAGVDGFLFLGDAVGYGAHPNETCDILRDICDHAVLGNHDAAIVGKLDYEEYYDAAREALDWTNDCISKDNRAWLDSLPYTTRAGEVGLCHGSPMDPEAFDYLFAPEQAEEMIPHMGDLAAITLIGHSHLTISFRLMPNGVVPLLGEEIRYGLPEKYVVTAGSVGQPRDRNPQLCCGILDAEERFFSFVRLDYDVERTRKSILEAGLPPVFADRLLVGM